MDDSNSLHRKRSFNQTSILKLLFRLPGIILVCQFFWEFIEKIRESEAKDPRKLRERSRSLHQGLAHSNYILLQTWMISNPKVFKPKHILKPLSPRKSCERWWCPDTIAKAKMMVAKVSRKVLRKGYMSISQWSLGFDHRSFGFEAPPHSRRMESLEQLAHWIWFLERLVLRKLQHTLEHTPDSQPPVYKGSPFMFVFWGTWGMFQGSVGILLDWWVGSCMFLPKFAEDGFAVLGTMISNVTFLKTNQGFGLYISAWKPPKKWSWHVWSMIYHCPILCHSVFHQNWNQKFVYFFFVFLKNPTDNVYKWCFSQ